jgi:RNA polymerase sigma-70 factor (ECF subfamily)
VETTAAPNNWERRIAERLAARDNTAFAELYDRFSPFVYRLANHVNRDRTAAEDVTQEVFLQLWEQPGRFDPDRGSLSAWLRTVTHRAAVASVRRQVASCQRERRATALVLGDSPAVEDVALSRVIADKARAAIAALPHPQRRVVELAYLHGLTFRQVAERLGVPEGTAKSRLRLALRALAPALQTDVAVAEAV